MFLQVFSHNYFPNIDFVVVHVVPIQSKGKFREAEFKISQFLGST